MPAYLGQEGYCLEFELREGKQHCQKDTPALLARVLNSAREITDRPLLLRLDGGNDAIENIDVVLEFNEQHPKQSPVDLIIKWNPRREDKEQWLKYAEQHGCWESPREGKRVALFSIQHQRQWRGYEYSVRRVMRVVERTIDKKGQILLTPEIELEGWWTSLLVSDKKKNRKKPSPQIHMCLVLWDSMQQANKATDPGVLQNPGTGVLVLAHRCQWFADRTNCAGHGKLNRLPLESRRCAERPFQHAQGLGPLRQPDSRGRQGFRCDPGLLESKLSASPDQNRRADSDR